MKSCAPLADIGSDTLQPNPHLTKQLGRTPLAVSRHKRGATAVDRRMVMAQVIEYYIPDRFKKPVKWMPPEQRGKIIDFPVMAKKSD